MRTASDHLKQHPNCRPSTLRFIELRNGKLDQLNRENEARRAARETIPEGQMREQHRGLAWLARKLGWRG